MRSWLVLCLVALLGAAMAEDWAADWALLGAAEPEEYVRLTIAVRQQNLKELNEVFWAVSTPSNPRYGKHLSADEVSALVRPSEDTLAAVVSWVKSVGIEEYELDYTRSNDFIVLTTTTEIATRLLSTKYLAYKHKISGARLLKAAGDYVIPEEMKAHVDFVSGHIGFPLARKPIFSVGAPLADTPVFPTNLRQRYNVSAKLVGTNYNSSYAVAEFQDQYYSPSDLQQFFQTGVPYAKNDYTVAHVIGGNDATDPGTEANLDIQFIMGVAPNITAWFWSNPNYDFFSDMVSWVGQIDNTTEAPWIQSVSYGSQDQWPNADIHNRIDIEFQKIGARGISLIIASGDYGTGCLLCVKFRPSWPASSQYVTSVGATRFINGQNGEEMAVNEFGSGGGFSSDDNQPSYQQAAVANYFKVQKDLPEKFFYNASGRGTPDVAALGIGFQVIVSGAVQSVGGTSASTPTFSAIISLLNDQRFNAGKGSLGFLNPWLYQTAAAHSDAFFDVTDGNNQHGCCGFTGFKCAPGWDPVTGLGTPNFAVLSQLV